MRSYSSYPEAQSVSDGDASSELLNQTLWEGRKRYLLQYPEVRLAAELHSHLAPVGKSDIVNSRIRLLISVRKRGESYRFESDIRMPSLFPILPFITWD